MVKLALDIAKDYVTKKLQHHLKAKASHPMHLVPAGNKGLVDW
jgi:hypothetical protein